LPSLGAHNGMRPRDPGRHTKADNLQQLHESERLPERVDAGDDGNEDCDPGE
jgi:hypothetical protein